MDLAAKDRLEPKGRDDRNFISLTPSCTTSVAEAPFVFRFSFARAEPAACAQVGVVLQVWFGWWVAGVKMVRSY